MVPVSFDVRAAVSRHPWSAVAIALVAGAGIALGERSRSAVVRAAALAAGTVAIAELREIAIRVLAAYVDSLLEERAQETSPRATA